MKVLKEKVMATLPDECLICNETFNKSAEDALKTWHIIQEGKYIGIYCPECWERAKKLIEEIKDGYANSRSDV